MLHAKGAAIESVEAPRQRLEDLFMQIVDEARRDQAETSGATEGGPTAEFLLKDRSGDALVEALQQAVQAPAKAAVRAESTVEHDASERAEVVDSLVEPATAERDEVKAARRKDEGSDKPQVDVGMIDQLLDDADRSDSA